MVIPLFSFLSFSLHLAVVVSMVLVGVPTQVHSSTLDPDIQVLRTFKESIDPMSAPSDSFIYSWDFSSDPCESTEAFFGILCRSPLDNSGSRIMAVDLDGIGYDGFLPPSIGNLTELTTLILSKNSFRGSIPESIGSLQKLTRLSLSQNQITGRIPDAITSLKQLKFLDLSQNHFQGSIPVGLATVRTLTHVSLSNNELSGTIPHLSGLWQLEALDLSSNHLSGNLPRFPASLKRLILRHNILSGHITLLRSLHRVTSLDVSDNKLSGQISREVLTLHKLVSINVSANLFTVLEPIQFPASEVQLQVLDAHSNRLRGHLPISLVGLKNLTSIDLSHNQFFGPMPKEYGDKVGKSWTRLFLQDNFLIGNLPPQLTNTPATIKGSFANNCLRCSPYMLNASTIKLATGENWKVDMAIQ